LQGDVVELLNGLSGILEANLAPVYDLANPSSDIMNQNLHLEQTLLLSLNTLKERWVRELELVVLRSLECVVRLGLRNLLNEFLKVTAVSAELEAVQVEHVSDGVVEEARVVRDDN
jgi:hypothetical protein